MRAGVDCVLLKGASSREYFYGGDRRLRPYSDIDLLVPASRAHEAEATLSTLGFMLTEPNSLSLETDPDLANAVGAMGATHGAAWHRASDAATVDLHTSVPQVTVPRQKAWDVLSRESADLMLVGAEVRVLNVVAAALVACLHAAHHGPVSIQAVEDLRRAVEVLKLSEWARCRDLADALGARAAMGAGLGLIPVASELLRHLELDPHPSRTMQLQWKGAPWAVSAVEAFRSSRGSSRLRLARQVLWPSADAMREAGGLARTGTSGLIRAYASRTGRIIVRLPGALAEWRRHRR